MKRMVGARQQGYQSAVDNHGGATACLWIHPRQHVVPGYDL